MSVCGICAHHRSRAPPCAACGFLTCRACAQRCVVEFPHDDAVFGACPACKRAWDVEELLERTGTTFWKVTFRAARRERLLQEEQGRLPETQATAQRLRHLAELRQELRELLRRIRHGEIELFAVYRDVQTRIRDLQTFPDASSSAAPRPRRCACGGFLSDGVCGACGLTTCTSCGEQIHGPDHRCDPTTLATVRAIQRNCRPCVRCGAPSTRSEGCAVMWCPQCKAFWNWDTGRLIETRRGAPHNPDHRAWLMTNGTDRAREIDDVPCGGLVDGHLLHHALLREFTRSSRVDDATPLIVEAAEALHTAQRLRHQYVTHWIPAEVNERHRIAFLNGVTNEDTFARALEREERTRLFHRHVGLVLQTLVFAGTDVLQRFSAHDDCWMTSVRLRALQEVVDAALARVETVYARKTPRLRPSWTWRLPRHAD